MENLETISKELGTFHLHSKFSDGKNTIKEILDYASNNSIKRVGFSDHAPLPFNKVWTMKDQRLIDYIETIDNLKKSYKEKIEVYKGLEVDYIKEYKGNLDIKKKYNLDYIIGSIHGFVYNNNFYTIDGDISNFNTLLNDKFNSDAKKMVTTYYKSIMEMIEYLKPDIVGHFDLIKLHNKNEVLFNEEEVWYKDIVVETLEKIKKKNLIVEINTGGFYRGKVRSFYPSFWIIKLLKEMDIKIMINSDSHWKEMLLASNKEAIEQVKNLGFKTIWYIKNGKFSKFIFD